MKSRDEDEREAGDAVKKRMRKRKRERNKESRKRRTGRRMDTGLDVEEKKVRGD